LAATSAVLDIVIDFDTNSDSISTIVEFTSFNIDCRHAKSDNTIYNPL